MHSEKNHELNDILEDGYKSLGINFINYGPNMLESLSPLSILMFLIRCIYIGTEYEWSFKKI